MWQRQESTKWKLKNRIGKSKTTSYIDQRLTANVHKNSLQCNGQKKSIPWFKNGKNLIKDLSKEAAPNVFMVECKHLQAQRDSEQNHSWTPHVYYDVCY